MPFCPYVIDYLKAKQTASGKSSTISSWVVWRCTS